MSDVIARVRAQLDEIGVEHERTGPRQVALRVPTRMRGAFGVVIDCGERTLAIRAFFMRAPDRDAEEVYRRALRRNLESSAWNFAVDDDGDLYLVARIWHTGVGMSALDPMLGELSTLVDASYEGLMRAGFVVPDGAQVGPPPGAGRS